MSGETSEPGAALMRMFHGRGTVVAPDILAQAAAKLAENRLIRPYPTCV